MLYSLEETTLGHIEVVEIVERFVHTSMGVLRHHADVFQSHILVNTNIFLDLPCSLNEKIIIYVFVCVVLRTVS